jgi:hypothetical protein
MAQLDINFKVSRSALIREILARPGRAIVSLGNVRMIGTGYEPLTQSELHALITVSQYVAANENLRPETLEQVVAAEFRTTSFANINREQFAGAVAFMIELTKEEDDTI